LTSFLVLQGKQAFLNALAMRQEASPGPQARKLPAPTAQAVRLEAPIASHDEERKSVRGKTESRDVERFFRLIASPAIPEQRDDTQVTASSSSKDPAVTHQSKSRTKMLSGFFLSAPADFWFALHSRLPQNVPNFAKLHACRSPHIISHP